MSRQRLDGGDPLSSGLFDDLPQPEASAAPVATPAESLATLDASKLNLRGGGSRGAQPPVAQPASKPSSAFADVDGLAFKIGRTGEFAGALDAWTAQVRFELS